MKFIDVHTHPGFSSQSFKEAAKENGIKYDKAGMQDEMKKLKVEKAVGIGWSRESNLFIADLADKADWLTPVFGVRLNTLPSDVELAKKLLKDGRLFGFKVLLGYDSVFPDDKALEPVYQLAEKHHLPVIYHTGDTWAGENKRARLKYAQPLRIDEVATAHPGIKIVIAHSGNPWTEDVAEIIYKNENCYADISGWFLGEVKSDYAELMRAKLKFMIAFSGANKIMFGTDWPLIKMDMYADFLMGAGLGGDVLEKIAYRNAKGFWGL